MSIKEKNGFILMEILVAMVILSGTILFLIQALSNILESNRQVRNNQLAFLTIDNIYNRLYSQEAVKNQDIIINGTKFHCDIDKEKIKENLSQITVKITWPDKSKFKSQSLSHRIAEE